MFWFWPSPPAALAQAGRPFSADQSHFLGTIQVPLFSCPQTHATVQVPSFQLPQIHATVQMPSPSYILPPYHPTLTQSLSFPFLSLPCHALAATHLCLQNYLYRERKNDVFMYFPAATHHFPRNTLCRERKNTFSGTFMQRHTFFKGIPCIADENHLCCRQNRPKHATPCSDTPFSAKFPVSRKGKRCFPAHSCRDTPFSEKHPVSRTKTTSAADKTAPNTPLPAATHHLPRNNLCRERGNAVFVKPPSR